MQQITHSQAVRLKLSRYTSVKPCKKCGRNDRYISQTGYDECENCKGTSSCAKIKAEERRHNSKVKKKSSRIWR